MPKPSHPFLFNYYITSVIFVNTSAVDEAKKAEKYTGWLDAAKNADDANIIKTFSMIKSGAKEASSEVGGLSKVWNGFLGGVSGGWKSLSAFGKIGLVIAGITAVVAIYNKIKNAGAEANQKMENALSAYKQDKADLESLNNQLETTKQNITELQSKGGLTILEKGQLDELRQTNRQLEIQKDILEKTSLKDAKETASKTTKAVNKNYSNLPTSTSEIAKQKEIYEGYGWDNTPLASNVSATIAYIQHLKDLQSDTQEGGELWKNYQSQIDSSTDSVWEAVSAWEDYKSTLESLPENALSDKDKIMLNDLTASIETVYKELDPAKWGQMKLDDFLSLDSISKEKEKLVERAKKDKYKGISVENLSEEFLNSARKSGLEEALGSDYAQIIVDAINSEAGAINVPAIKKSLHEKYGQTANNKKAYDWIENLSNEDTEIVYKLSLDPDSANWSLDQWMQKLKEYKESSEQFLSDLEGNATKTESVLSTIGDNNKLLNTSTNGQSVSLSAEQLKTYGDALEYVGGRWQLSYDKIKQMNLDKANEQIKANTEQMQKCEEQYRKNEMAISQYRNAIDISNEERVKEIQKLQEENANLESVWNEYQYLNSAIDEATSAYQRWLDAQSAPSAGDYSSNIGSAFGQLSDVVKKGKGYCTTKFKAAVDLLVPEEVSAEGQKAIQKWSRSVQKYFNKDGSLNSNSFYNDLFTKGFAEKSSDGTWSLMKGVKLDDIAKGFNMSKEAIKGFFDALSADYGFEFDWFDELPQTFDSIKKRAQECAESINTIKKANGETFSTNLKFDGSDSEQNMQSTLQELQELKKEASSGAIHLDDSQLQAVNVAIRYCVAGLQQLNQPYIMSLNFDGADGTMATIGSNLQQIQQLEDQISQKKSIDINADVSDEQAQIAALIDEINQLKNSDGTTIDINGVFDTASISADNVQEVINSITENSQFAVELKAHVTAEETPDLNSDAQIVYTPEHAAVDQYLATLGDLSYKVNYTYTENGSKPTGIVDVNGSANVGGSANAGGNWGVKQSGPSLTGELGPEIQVDPSTGRWNLLGENGPEFRYIKKGSIIFNHLQTASLLKNGWATGRGHTYASGSAFISGTNPQIPTRVSDIRGGSGNTSSSNSKSSSSKNDKIDWPEIAIKRIEALISRLTNIVSSSFKKVETKLTASNSAIENTMKQIEAEQNAYNTYMREANKVGLAESLAVQVRDGNVYHIGSYDEDDTKKIQEYQKW